MNTGEIIKKLRIEKHLTQEQLGNLVGVQKSAVSKWERGDTTNIRRDTIDALAILFGVRPSYIIGETEEELLLDADEINLMKRYRKADPNTKQIIQMLLEEKK